MSKKRRNRARRRRNELVQRRLRTESLERRELLAADLPFHNEFMPTDVNGDYSTHAVDALLIINEINRTGPRSLVNDAGGDGAEGESAGDPLPMIDTSGDNLLSPVDALRVINALNAEGEDPINPVMEITFDFTDVDGNDLTRANVGDVVQFNMFAKDVQTENIGTEQNPILIPAPTGIFQVHVDAKFSEFPFELDYGQTQVVRRPTVPFTITFNGETTDEIAVGNNRDLINNITAALEDLPNVEEGDIYVQIFQNDVEITFQGSVGKVDHSDISVHWVSINTTLGPTKTFPAELPPIGADEDDPRRVTYQKAFRSTNPYDTNRMTAEREDKEFGEVGTFMDNKALIQGGPGDAVLFAFARMTVTGTGRVVAMGDAADDAGNDYLVFDSKFPTDDDPENIKIPLDRIDFPDAEDEFAIIDLVKIVDAFDDSATVAEDSGTTSIDVFANDSVTEGDPSISAVSDPSNGTAVINGLDIDYTPDDDFFGEDTFTYTLTNGALSDTATVTVTVTPVNDNPTANDDTATVDEDTTESDNAIDVLANDTIAPDADETLSITSVGADEDDVMNIKSSASTEMGGTVSIDNSGDTPVVRYAPPADYFGTDSFYYMINDGTADSNDKAKVTVTVDNVNDPPIAVDDGLPDDVEIVVDEDSMDNEINVLVNDSAGPNESESLTIVGTSNLTAGATAVVDNGQILYSPAPDFYGEDTFTYTISDGEFEDSATVTITVNNLNDDPTANDDFLNVLEESTNNVLLVLDNDTFLPDPTETLTITDVSVPDQGGTVSISQDEMSLIFTPDVGFTDVSKFTYTISDGNGGSDTATVEVTVDPLTLPRARTDTLTIDEDSGTHTIDILDNDEASENATLVFIEFVEEDGVITPNGTVEFKDGVAHYTPNDDFFGTDTFRYIIDDTNTGNNDGPAEGTVRVTVNPVNDAPVANDDTYTGIQEDSEDNVLDLLSNDSIVPDADETLTIISVDNDNVTIADDGSSVSYTPPADFFGKDTFTYTIRDDGGLQDTASVTITVDNVNDNPTANEDNVTIDEDVNTPIDVLANDSFLPDPTETLTITDVSGYRDGATVTFNGVINYQSPPDFFGEDTLTYTISDGNGGTATGTVNITIDNVNDNPTANNDGDDVPFLILKDSQDNEINVLVNDTFEPDPEETLTIVLVDTTGLRGSVSIIDGGSALTYTPRTGDKDVIESFTYTIRDDDGLEDTATVTVNVVDFIPSNVTGYVFLDLVTSNGKMDAGEGALGGVPIRIQGTNIQDQTVDITVWTDENGYFDSGLLVPGEYYATSAQPMFMVDGKDTIGTQGGLTANDRFDFELGLFGTDADYNFFGENGIDAKYLTIAELFSSTPAQGAVVAMNTANNSRYWYSMLEGWEGYTDISATLSSDNHYLTITAKMKGNDTEYTRTVDWKKFHIMSEDGDARAFRIKGTPEQLGFPAIAHSDDEGEGEGEAVETEAAMFADAVDRLMQNLG